VSADSKVVSIAPWCTAPCPHDVEILPGADNLALTGVAAGTTTLTTTAGHTSTSLTITVK
jgi:hypothetical protein